MELFDPVDDLHLLPCQHYFHQACTAGWLQDHDFCPMCKLAVEPEAPKKP